IMRKNRIRKMIKSRIKRRTKPPRTGDLSLNPSLAPSLLPNLTHPLNPSLDSTVSLRERGSHPEREVPFLRPHDALPTSRYPRGRVARIYNQTSMAYDPIVVVGRVVGDNNDTVLGGQERFRQRHAAEPYAMVPHVRQGRDKRVVIRHDGTPALQQLHNRERRRFARVVHVFLVGNSQQTNTAPLDRLALLVQGLRNP